MSKLIIFSAFLALVYADVSHLVKTPYNPYNRVYNGQYSGQYNGAYNGQFPGRYNGVYNGQYPGQYNGVYNGQYDRYNRYNQYNQGQQIPILRSENNVNPDGSYRYAYETANGISAQEQGVGGQGATGSFAWTSPEGLPVQISYVADENGYQPQGAAIPTSPPIPAAILRSIEYNRAHPNEEEEQNRIYNNYDYNNKNFYNNNQYRKYNRFYNKNY